MDAPRNEHDPTGMAFMWPLVIFVIYLLPFGGWVVGR